jgi:hypothetical protein
LSSVFVPVATSHGIEIFAPETGYISFFNSPYYSHQHALAVDIYPNTEAFIRSAPSPVEGTILHVYEAESPRPRYFRAPEIENVIVIVSAQNPHSWVRILHVNCYREVGTRVNVGDSLGNLERSGFFNFWTAKHMHVEVRRKREPLRAKGAFPMEPTNPDQNIEGERESHRSPLLATKVHTDYLLADIHQEIVRVGRFWGLGCTVNHQMGILDCGLPHYGYGGVHLLESRGIQSGDSVLLWGMDIGQVICVHRQYAMFKCRPLLGFVGTVPLRGLSLYVWLAETRTIKLVPEKPFTPPQIEELKEPIQFRRR